MSGSTVALIGALFYDHPQLMPILDEHLEDNEGEILAYLVLSDVIRWMAENYYPARSDCVRIIEWRRLTHAAMRMSGISSAAAWK
jgi:hypothetical protein